MIDDASASVANDVPALELDEIQATVLRQRPAPYFGTHVLLRIDDAQAGREYLRRLTPHVESAANWWNAATPWLSIGISFSGLKALGVPESSLQSFPEAFRQGMAARAAQLGDVGANDPSRWEIQYGKGDIHIGLTAFADSEEHWRSILVVARRQFEGLSGVSALAMDDFGAQPNDLNSLGYKDGIDQPSIEGSGVEPLPGQDRPIKAGEFILGYPDETNNVPPFPQPAILGRNGTFVGFRKYQSRVGAFNRFLHSNGNTELEREWLAAKLVGRWRSGAPLSLAPDADDPSLGSDSKRNNDFGYAGDPRGLRAPLGCHIRRMNPRDASLTRLTDVRLHRLIRRGTTYGKPYEPNDLTPEADETPRGAHFLFISSKAMATIEFLQQEWINDGNFAGINDEHDPIIGLQADDATFTVPKQPVRRRLRGIETFNVLRGGEYFFMPSLSALKWLGKL